MKVLCLHGREQSSQIFRAQLRALMEVVASETEVLYDFVDAPKQCEGRSSSKAQAVYNFYDAGTIDEIRRAHDWLTDKLTADGPYDGVIGFCQGATVASSYLQSFQWQFYQDQVPFKFAIFIGGSLSLQAIQALGIAIPEAAKTVAKETDSRRHADLGPSAAHVSLARQAMFNSDDCFGLNLNRIPRELKIRIPTLHVWSADDPAFPTSIHLASLCDPYLRKIYTHGGAHEVPQGTENTQKLGELALWCMQRATWPGDRQTP
ncbi:serine hydrolase FSH [Xylaria arbuscula]|nr:serine hydrolase FSH [Xylaria arbuscula]